MFHCISRVSLVLTLLAVGMASAQVVSWQRITGGNADDFFAHVVYLSGGNTVHVGTTSSAGAGGSDVLAVCLDPNGNVLWRNAYGQAGNDRGQNATVLSGGSIAICGQTQASMGANPSGLLMVVKASNGNIEWVRTLDSSTRNEELIAITQLGNGNLVVAGGNGPSTPCPMAAFDKLGNLLWNREVTMSAAGGTPTDYLVQFSTLPGTNTVAGVGFSRTQGSTTFHDNLVANIDGLNGNLLVARYDVGTLTNLSNGSFTDFVRLPSGDMIAVGTQLENNTNLASREGVVMCLSGTNGSVKWARRFASPNGGEDGAHSVGRTGSALYIAGFATDSTGDMDGILITADTLGNFIAAKAIGANGTDRFNSLNVVGKTLYVNGQTTGALNGITSPNAYALRTEAGLTGTCNERPYALDWTTSTDFAAAFPTPSHTSPYTSATPNITLTDLTTDMATDNPCCRYAFGQTVASCSQAQTGVCLPLNATEALADSLIGLDFCITYDPAQVAPTGSVTLGSLVTHNGLYAQGTHCDYAINTSLPGQVHVSIYYTSAAPAIASFMTSTGNVACVQFTPVAGMQPGLPMAITACNLLESYHTYTLPACAEPGSLTIEEDTALNGTVLFWDDLTSPLRYDAANPNDYLQTRVYGNAPGLCDAQGAYVLTDINGNFSHPIAAGASIRITRDIANNPTPSPATLAALQNSINGMDAYTASLVTTANAAMLLPTAFQVIAMDVNMDDVVSAGDITLMQQRAVNQVVEYPQGWTGYPAPATDALDWRFISRNAMAAAADFQLSAAYPFAAGAGYYRYDVPNVAPCLPVAFSTTPCLAIPNDTIHAVLLGDADGSWNLPTPGDDQHVKKSMPLVTFDLGAATKNADCSLNIPVSISNFSGTLKALDYVLDFDQAALQVLDAAHATPGMSSAHNVIASDYVAFTSYSTLAGGMQQAAYTLTVKALNETGTLSAADFTFVAPRVNGRPANATFVGQASCVTAATSLSQALTATVSVAPQPMTDILTVAYGPQVHTLELCDLRGSTLRTLTIDGSGTTTLDVAALAPGVYALRINAATALKVIK